MHAVALHVPQFTSVEQAVQETTASAVRSLNPGSHFVHTVALVHKSQSDCAQAKQFPVVASGKYFSAHVSAKPVVGLHVRVLPSALSTQFTQAPAPSGYLPAPQVPHLSTAEQAVQSVKVGQSTQAAPVVVVGYFPAVQAVHTVSVSHSVHAAIEQSEHTSGSTEVSTNLPVPQSVQVLG